MIRNANTQQNISEKLFEQYLQSQDIKNYRYEPDHPQKKKRPDYFVEIDGIEYVFDVKEFEVPKVCNHFGAYDPITPVREKINSAARQFKEFKDRHCSLVLFNPGNPHIELTDPMEMQGAMYGDPGFIMDFDIEAGRVVEDSTRMGFTQRGKVRWQPDINQDEKTRIQNTTLSAIITLRYLYRDPGALGVIVYSNIYARKPLPLTLFTGQFDERYDLLDGNLIRVFAGSGVIEFEERRKAAKEIADNLYKQRINTLEGEE